MDAHMHQNSFRQEAYSRLMSNARWMMGASSQASSLSTVSADASAEAARPASSCVLPRREVCW
jgi:hypothetical protein